MLSSCVKARYAADNAKPADGFQWFYSMNDVPKGVFFVVHGLNNNARVMDPLIEELVHESFHVLRITLTGHAANTGFTTDGTMSDWLKDVQRAVNKVKQEYPDLPIYHMGFSLGALTTLAFVQENEGLNIAKMILIAPALFPRKSSRLLRPFQLLRLLRANLPIPSLVPRKYRAHRYTSVGAYTALLELSAKVRQEHVKNLAKIPTLLVINRKDSVVDYARTYNWLQTEELATWQILVVDPRPEEAGSYGHLLLNRRALGGEQWQLMITTIAKFLR